MSEQQPPRGFVAYRRKSVPPKEIVQGFAGIMTGVVSDALDRGGAMDYSIKPVGPGMKVCGPAITVRARPTDSLARDAALRMAEPGDVLVIATGNYTVTGTWGDHASYNAKGLGLAGMVTDGLCRDIVGIREAGLPVFARGFAPNAPIGSRDSQINVPVSVGGQIVHPGDIILGDENGVVVIPQRFAAQILEASREILKHEDEAMADIAAGKFISPTLDARLAAAGFRISRGVTPIRASAWSLIAGGLLFALGNLLHPLEHNEAAYTYPTWATAHVVIFLSVPLLILGFPALQAALGRRGAGRLGLTAIVLGVVGLVAMAPGLLAEAFIAPAVGLETMQRLEATGFGVFGGLLSMLWIASSIVLAAACYRAGSGRAGRRDCSCWRRSCC